MTWTVRKNLNYKDAAADPGASGLLPDRSHRTPAFQSGWVALHLAAEYLEAVFLVGKYHGYRGRSSQLAMLPLRIDQNTEMTERQRDRPLSRASNLEMVYLKLKSAAEDLTRRLDFLRGRSRSLQWLQADMTRMAAMSYQSLDYDLAARDMDRLSAARRAHWDFPLARGSV